MLIARVSVAGIKTIVRARDMDELADLSSDAIAFAEDNYGIFALALRNAEEADHALGVYIEVAEWPGVMTINGVPVARVESYAIR